MWRYKDLLRSFAKDLLNQFKLSDASVSLGVVDFASQATVISHLSTDAAAVSRAIDSSNNPRGYTHISEGLKVGLEVIDGAGKRAGARRVMLLLTDGEQTYSFCYQPVGKARECGTDAAIAMAKDVQPQVDTLFSIGFGGVLDKTVNALASAPSSEHAYRADDIQQLMAHFANFCSFLKPKPPPPPSPPPLPPLPPPPPLRPPPPPAPCWCTKTGVCTPQLKVALGLTLLTLTRTQTRTPIPNPNPSPKPLTLTPNPEPKRKPNAIPTITKVSSSSKPNPNPNPNEGELQLAVRPLLWRVLEHSLLLPLELVRVRVWVWV